MKRFAIGALVVGSAATAAALFAATRGESSPIPVSGFDRAAKSSDTLPQTPLATKLVVDLGLNEGKSRRVAVDTAAERALFVVPSRHGEYCLLLVGVTTDTENIYGCTNRGQAFFEGGVSENVRLMVHELGGQPEAPTTVELAGAVRNGTGITSLRFTFGSKSVSTPVSRDGGFLLKTSVPGVGLTKAIALDANNAQVEQLAITGS